METGKHAKERRGFFRRLAENPAQPPGWAVGDGTQSDEIKVPEFEALEAEKRQESAQWDDANNMAPVTRDVFGPGSDMTGPYAPIQAALKDVSDAMDRLQAVENSLQATGVPLRAAGAPFAGWGNIVPCPDCRGAGDCSGCFKGGTKASANCEHCGGSRICPTCKGSTYARVAPAEAPKTKAAATKAVMGHVYAPKESCLGARVVVIDLEEHQGIMGKVAGIDLGEGRMLTRWADKTSTLELVDDYEFDPA